MPEHPARSHEPGPARRRPTPDRPSWWPLAAIGGGLASAVLAGAAWSATAPPTTASHRTVRESEVQADPDAGTTGSPVATRPAAATTRAGSAALAAVGPGTVVQVASGPTGAAGSGYVVQVAAAAGPAVHVLVDDDFVVRSVRVGD